MIKDLMEYGKVQKFMDAYYNQLFSCCFSDREKWDKLKAQLEVEIDKDPNNRIYLAAMELMEFEVKICEDDNYIEEHPLIRVLDWEEYGKNDDDDDE